MLTILQHVTTERLQKAINALADASLTVTLTRQTEAEIRALVKNGESNKEYDVTLTEAGACCSCPDALYRGVVCKHEAILALHTIRHPQEKPSEEEWKLDEQLQEEKKPNLRLRKTREQVDREGWKKDAEEIYGVAV